MNKNNKNISIAQVKEAFNTAFSKAIKNLEIEQEEEENFFIFELELVEKVKELLMPDGIIISFVDFKECIIEGLIDGPTFLESIKENKYLPPIR